MWQALWTYYFSRLVRPEDTVLDLDCGYGDFINTVKAKRRIAFDMWRGFPAHLKPGIEPVLAPVNDLSAISERSIDFAFASNLFEHVSQDVFAETLAGLRTRLAANGILTILQPNYRYAYREYFDDYTHVAVYSHISLADFLDANGYEVFDVRPRFLPLTVKSRLPVFPPLIALYLASPIKLLGKQMLLRARPR